MTNIMDTIEMLYKTIENEEKETKQNKMKILTELYLIKCNIDAQTHQIEETFQKEKDKKTYIKLQLGNLWRKMKEMREQKRERELQEILQEIKDENDYNCELYRT